VNKGGATALKDAIVARATEAGAQVLVVDGALVFGKDHLRSALFHALRAIEEGTNASKSIPMETLLYASGERQLSAAIKKMSVSEDTEEVVVARLTRDTIEPDPSWQPMSEEAMQVTVERLRAFGITDRELATVGADRGRELVLERVAAVDIQKR